MKMDWNEENEEKNLLFIEELDVENHPLYQEAIKNQKRDWLLGKAYTENGFELEIEYIDPLFEVYSYQDGDFIVGDSFFDIEEIPKWLREQLSEEDLEEIFDYAIEKLVKVPFSKIRYTIMRKRDKNKKRRSIVRMDDQELLHLAIDSVIETPDGELVEPDDERSPLRGLGII